MITSFGKQFCTLTVVLTIISKLKCFHSTDVPVDIKDVCRISNERYPDEDHNTSYILHTYETCLQHLDQYPSADRESLMKQLIIKLECFKEDLKQSYYAGNIKYNDVELVENMEIEIRNKGVNLGLGRLSTTKCNPARQARSTVKHIIPLVVTGTLSEKKKACDAIFKHGNITQIEIPTPKLDSNKEPKELTVPLTCPTTYKVDSLEAENALTQYYKVVMKCLTLTTEHKIQVFRFNKRFYDWLTQAVLPHLKDDKCYPAFGSVLRIVETMRENDFVPKNATANFIFYRQKDLGKNEEELKKKENNTSKIIHSHYFPLMIYPLLVFICIIIIFLAWTTGCCASWFCEKNYDSDSSSTEVFYYPIEETPSVSLDLDDFSSDPPDSQRSDVESKNDFRQRGGDDSHVYSMTYEQENTLTGLPLKRQWPSKDSSSSQNEPASPGKRKKTKWRNY